LPGQTVNSSVSVLDNAAGLAAADFTISYDPTLLGIYNASSPQDMTSSSYLASLGWGMAANASNAGTIYISLYSANYALTVNSTQLLNLVFHVLNNAPGGTSPIVLSPDSKLNGGGLAISAANGSILVPAVINGSLNGDVIQVVREAANSDRSDVFVNNTLVNTIMLSSVPNVIVNDFGGNDQLTVDWTYGNPLPSGGLVYNGGSGLNKLFVVGTNGADNVLMTSTQITLNGSAPIVYGNIQGFGFDLKTGADVLTLTSGTLALGKNDAISDGTSIVVDGGVLDLNGQSETVGAVTLLNGSILNGSLNSNSYDIESGTVTATLAGPGALSKNTAGQASTQVVNTSNITVDAGQLTATSINTGTLTICAGTTLTIAPIAGGPLANDTLMPLATLALQPIILETSAQTMTANTVAPSSTAETAIVGALTNNTAEQATTQVVNTSNITVDAGQPTATSINTDSSTIGAEATLTDAPIAGGPLANGTLMPLATPALQPILSETFAQIMTANTVAPSSTAENTLVAAGPLAPSTVIAAPIPASSDAASAPASSCSLSKADVLDAVATPAAIIANKALPVRLVESTPARQIDTAINCLLPQSPIYCWLDSAASHKIIENGLEQSLTTRNENIASTPTFASLRDDLPPRVEKSDKHRTTAAINSRQAHIAALQTVVQNSRWTDADAEADFGITQHVRSGKHSKQLEKAVDEVLAEEEDVIPALL
jgi:hypothetical protein